MTLTRKKFLKIQKQIDNLAKKGKDNIFEYYKYIDELVKNGDFSSLEQVLFEYYNIDIVGKSVDTVKKSTWKSILLQTNSTFATQLKRLCDSKSIYQISNNFYLTTGTSSVLLGQIKEIDNFTTDVKYFLEQKEFSKVIDARRIVLDVYKNGNIIPVIEDKPTLSKDKNLLNRYLIGIEILLGSQYILVNGYWDDAGYWDDYAVWIDG
jgi:hypothetical protein